MRLFKEPFWQCFLKPIESITSTSIEVSRIDKVGMDSAKSHCCQRASSSTCRKLCQKTFTNDWSTTWQEFHRRCLNEISEDPLLTCLDEGNYFAPFKLIFLQKFNFLFLQLINLANWDATA